MRDSPSSSRHFDPSSVLQPGLKSNTSPAQVLVASMLTPFKHSKLHLTYCTHFYGHYRSVPGKRPPHGKRPGSHFRGMNGERPLPGKRPGIPYLPEYKSQLQHLFLLLISRVCLILRMLRILRSISRTESEISPVWAWSQTVVQRMRKYTGGIRTRWRMDARKRRWRSG